MVGVLPGQGRVPYTPLPKRRPAYTGPIVVAREDGLPEALPYGRQIKRLCRENIGDERFTVAERTYDPGQVVQRDSEAIHVFSGQGVFRAWPKHVPPDLPVQAPLLPGMEIVVDQFVRDVIVPPGGVGHKPMCVYHRPFNPSDPDDPNAEDCYWIHSVVVFTHRGSRLPQVHLRQHGLDGKTPIWENTSHL